MHEIKVFLIFFNMLKDYLDIDIYNLIIKNFNFNDINEIRMRVNQCIIICLKNKKYYLKDTSGNNIKACKTMLTNFIKRVSENSIYAFNESIINGYITLPKGIRVGLCGTVILNDNKIVTIKDFQAVNIRIPHVIQNCSLPVYDILTENGIENTLIVSAPGGGKTTFLRDFIYQLNQHNIAKNILIVDERNEICSVANGIPQIDLGGFCDVYTNCSKKYAFKNGIRSMGPDVVMCDEIDIETDLLGLVDCMNCGVKVVATIHASSIKDLSQKSGFDIIMNKKFFSRFVVLTNDNGPGTITGVFDEKLNCIYCKY